MTWHGTRSSDNLESDALEGKLFHAVQHGGHAQAIRESFADSDRSAQEFRALDGSWDSKREQRGLCVASAMFRQAQNGPSRPYVLAWGRARISSAGDDLSQARPASHARETRPPLASTPQRLPRPGHRRHALAYLPNGAYRKCVVYRQRSREGPQPKARSLSCQ